MSCTFAIVFLGIFSWICIPVFAFEHRDTIIITADDIKEMNVHKISDVLSQVPGVKAGSTFVSIRGSYKVKVMVDGRPINDPTSSHGGVKFDLVFLKTWKKSKSTGGRDL